MRIIITQRSDDHGSYNERRDGLDRNWYATARRLFGPHVTLFSAPNDPEQSAAFLDVIAPQGILLTGGNDLVSFAQGQNVEPDRDALERALLTHAAEQNLAVLAVCRGFQFVNEYCGGTATSVQGHVTPAHDLTHEQGAMSVNSYHTHAIAPAGLAPDLEALAWDHQGNVEAARHAHRPWLGIMWHPERAQPGPDADRWLSEHLPREMSLRR